MEKVDGLMLKIMVQLYEFEYIWGLEQSGFLKT